MSQRLRSQRLLALFAAGWLLLNFPLLTLWDRDVLVARPAAAAAGAVRRLGRADRRCRAGSCEADDEPD